VLFRNANFKCEVASLKCSQDRQEQLGISKAIKHYYGKRYFYFTRFDEGIQMDHESWYSVIAEPISKYMAGVIAKAGFGGGVVLDAFAGVGGIAIHLARLSERLLANDISPEKVAMLRHNAKIYKVLDRI
jgi:trimethylguanosine synthase